jgi:hypothetical protein
VIAGAGRVQSCKYTEGSRRLLFTVASTEGRRPRFGWPRIPGHLSEHLSRDSRLCLWGEACARAPFSSVPEWFLFLGRTGHPPRSLGWSPVVPGNFGKESARNETRFLEKPQGAAEKVRTEMVWIRKEPSLPPLSSGRQLHHRARILDCSVLLSGFFLRRQSKGGHSRMARLAATQCTHVSFSRRHGIVNPLPPGKGEVTVLARLALVLRTHRSKGDDTNPTRQRGFSATPLAGASGWYRRCATQALSALISNKTNGPTEGPEEA